MTEAEAHAKARRLNRELGESGDPRARAQFYLERQLSSSQWVVELCGENRTPRWRDRVAQVLDVLTAA
jgi:hypothetical protein